MVENRRKSELGRFGETVVCERLAQNGYNCTYLGGTNRCFDIEAYKDGQKFLFSIKTRNHTNYMGDIKKDYYNLFFSRNPRDRYAVVNAALEIARGRSATPMWGAVRVDTASQRFDIYYGRVIDLPDKRYIPMDASERLKHLKLAQGEFDQRIKAAWSNVRKKDFRATGGESDAKRWMTTRNRAATATGYGDAMTDKPPARDNRAAVGGQNGTNGAIQNEKLARRNRCVAPGNGGSEC